VRKTFAARALIVLLCVALVALLFLNPTGAKIAALLIPFPIFFATLPQLTARPGKSRVRCQPISFRSLDSSRAPPQL
jgi:hypothetical protein